MDAALSPLVLWSLRFFEKGLQYFYRDLFGQLNFLKMTVTSTEDYRSFEEYVNKYENNKRFNYFFLSPRIHVIFIWNKFKFWKLTTDMQAWCKT